MLNQKAKLSEKLFSRDVDMEASRNGYGEGLLAAGERDERVVALCADLTESTRTQAFKEKFPDRFVEIGVAEQLLATVAAGMAAYGKIPFISSYAAFSPGRNWEQIRTAIALNDVPVKIAGAHAGVSVGPDGATHQALEDIATMRVIPNMIVVYPADAVEAKKATMEAAKNGKPTYLRFAREKTPVITSGSSPFKIGRAEILWQGRNPEAAIIAAGPMVFEALSAARELAKKKIDTIVLNSHTIKPLDVQAVIKAAKLTGAVVTVEEAQASGGLGGAVSEVLAKNFPVPMEFVGVEDRFGESGKLEELMSEFGLKSKNIAEAVLKLIARKND